MYITSKAVYSMLHEATLLIFRRLPHPVLHRSPDLRSAALPPGGVRGTVSGRGRHERGGPALPHLQGSGLLCPHDGLPGERVLHHHRGLDPLLHPQQPLHHRRRAPLEQLRERT